MLNMPTNLASHIKTDHFRKRLTIIDMSNNWPKDRCQKNLTASGLVTTDVLMNYKA
jgi:hypothetical protein